MKVGTSGTRIDEKKLPVGIKSKTGVDESILPDQNMKELLMTVPSLVELKTANARLRCPTHLIRRSGALLFALLFALGCLTTSDVAHAQQGLPSWAAPSDGNQYRQAEPRRSYDRPSRSSQANRAAYQPSSPSYGIDQPITRNPNKDTCEDISCGPDQYCYAPGGSGAKCFDIGSGPGPNQGEPVPIGGPRLSASWV